MIRKLKTWEAIMKITVKSSSSNSFDESTLSYAEEKLEKLEKIFQPIREADLVFNESKGVHMAEVTMYVNGKIIRAETKDTNVRSAIDKLKDKLERQIRRYKEKTIDKKRHVKKEYPQEVVPIIDDEEMPQIIREKKFSIVPLSDEDAVEQLELLGHDFFLYYRISKDYKGLAVLYRRKHNGYGILMPEE
jgi:putative sigma-54 modulation protein